jgi:hypothetical protein
VSDNKPVRHPLQLVKAELTEVQYRAFTVPDPTVDVGMLNLGFGRSDYVPLQNQIDASIVLEAGKNDPASGSPYYLKMELKGHFKIEDGTLSQEKVQAWIERAAPYVLLPFMREHAYGFTVRAGVMPIMIPLYQVPTAPLVGESEGSALAAIHR